MKKPKDTEKGRKTRKPKYQDDPRNWRKSKPHEVSKSKPGNNGGEAATPK